MLSESQQDLPSKDYVLLEAADFNFQHFFKQTLKEKKQQFLLQTADAKSVLKKIKNQVQVIKAAGGLVKNANNDYLFIFRNKKWDLPKGKLEVGEKMSTAALREVEEECGITVAHSSHKIVSTYHVYTLGKDIVLKKTNWYAMEVEGNPVLIPQQEEGITDAKWTSVELIPEYLKNTYPSIIDVVESAKLLHRV